MDHARKRTPRAIGFWRDPKIGDHRFRHPIALVDSEWDLATSGYREIEESERKAVMEKRIAEVPEFEAELGVGTEACSERGCERRVSGGMDRCAWHVAGGDS